MSKFIYTKEDDITYASLNPRYKNRIAEKKYNFLLKKSNIPEFYWDIEFSNYKGDISRESVNKLIYFCNHCDEEKFKHVHFYLFGINSSQKCISKDSLILSDKGFQYINENEENFQDGFSDYIKPILTKEGILNTSNFFKEKSIQTIKVETELGTIIEGTFEHPILILDKDCNFVFKKLEDIQIEDIVIINYNTQIYNINLYQINFVYNRSRFTNNLKEIILPSHVDENLAKFLGYFVANGSSSENTINICSKNIKIQKDIKHILENYKLNYHYPPYGGDGMAINSSIFIEFIYSLFGITKKDKFTARYKYVPKCILQSPKNIQIAFLKTLIDCDSYLDKNNRLRYFTASYRLCREVQLLLFNMGIVCNIIKTFLEKYKHTYYELVISGEDAVLYFNLIGESLKYGNPEIKLKKRDYYRNIPYIFLFIKDNIKLLRKSILVKSNGTFLHKGKLKRFDLGYLTHYGKSNTLLSKVQFNLINSKFDKTIIDNEIVGNIKNKLKNFIDNPNYIFTKVIKKEILLEDKYVYDFTIPEVHNFYANGFINHNTSMAGCVLKELLKKGKECYFVLAGELIDKLLKIQGFTINEEIESYINKLKNADMILIDDAFDPTKSMMWSRPESASLVITAWDIFLRSVISSNTKIIMTSNIPVNIIKEKFGESMYHLIDRNFVPLGFYDDYKMERKKKFENLFGD